MKVPTISRKAKSTDHVTRDGVDVPRVEVRSQGRILATGGKWWDGDHYVPHNGGVKKRRLY